MSNPEYTETGGLMPHCRAICPISWPIETCALTQRA